MKDTQIENKISMMKKILNFLKRLEEISHIEDNWWGKRIRFLKAIQLPCLVVLFHWFTMSHVFVFLGGVICRDGWSTTWTIRCGYIFGFLQLFMINLSIMWFIMPPAYQEETPDAVTSEAKLNINPDPAIREPVDLASGTDSISRRMRRCDTGRHIEAPREVKGIRSIN